MVAGQLPGALVCDPPGHVPYCAWELARLIRALCLHGVGGLTGEAAGRTVSWLGLARRADIW